MRQMQSPCSHNRTRIVEFENHEQFCSAMLLIFKISNANFKKILVGCDAKNRNKNVCFATTYIEERNKKSNKTKSGQLDMLLPAFPSMAESSAIYLSITFTTFTHQLEE